MKNLYYLLLMLFIINCGKKVTPQSGPSTHTSSRRQSSLNTDTISADFESFDIFKEYPSITNKNHQFDNIKKGKPFDKEEVFTKIINTSLKKPGKPLKVNIRGKEFIYKKMRVEHGGACWTQTGLALLLNYFSYEDWEQFFHNLQSLINHPLSKIIQKENFKEFKELSQTNDYKKLAEDAKQIIMNVKKLNIESIERKNLSILEKFVRQTYLLTKIISGYLENNFEKATFSFYSVVNLDNYSDFSGGADGVKFTEQLNQRIQRYMISVLKRVLEELYKLYETSNKEIKNEIEENIKKHFDTSFKDTIKDINTIHNYLNNDFFADVLLGKSKYNTKETDLVKKYWKVYVKSCKLLRKYDVSDPNKNILKYILINKYKSSYITTLGQTFVACSTKFNQNKELIKLYKEIVFEDIVPKFKNNGIKKDHFLFQFAKKLKYDMIYFFKNTYYPDIDMFDLKNIVNNALYLTYIQQRGADFWGAEDDFNNYFNIYFPYKPMNLLIPQVERSSINKINKLKKAYPIIYLSDEACHDYLVRIS